MIYKLFMHVSAWLLGREMGEGMAGGDGCQNRQLAKGRGRARHSPPLDIPSVTDLTSRMHKLSSPW